MADSAKQARAAQRKADCRRAMLRFVATIEEASKVLQPAIMEMCRRADASGDLSECEDAIEYLENQLGEKGLWEVFGLLDCFGCRLPDYARFICHLDPTGHIRDCRLW